MENTRKSNKSKINNGKAGQSNEIAYKHFTSAGNKQRRKNRKKYFEHDTRTRKRTGGSAAAIKKIKFNNEINIFETNNGVTAESVNLNKVKRLKAQKHGKNAIAQKKQSRVFRPNRRNSIGASNATNIQTTTKKLQKQLIETQKKLQKQLIALQEQQREQNNSFLALIHSNCMHGNANIKINQNNNDDDDIHRHAGQISVASSNLYEKQNQNQNQNLNNHCSEHFYKCFTDQSKCSIDKMANGNKATAIRTFVCDSKIKDCTTVSTIDPDTKSYTPPKELCNIHHCSSCIGHPKAIAGDELQQAADINFKSNTNSNVKSHLNSIKRPKIHNKKPFLKSIILSATSNSHSTPLLNIKQEIDIENTCTNHPKDSVDTRFGELKASEAKSQTEMQFSDTKKTKQINSYFKSNNFVQQQNARSYSPPLPTTHRLASMVASESHAQTGNNHINNNNNNVRRSSHTSRDRKSNKKRKKRRRNLSRDSRSRSRSYSTSRSSSSRSRTRSRSYRRRSTSRSRSSSSENYSRRHSPDRKKKSLSKNRDVFRRSAKRDERSSCGCNCNCINYCKKASKNSTSKTQSKSPSNDSAFSSKRSNTSPIDGKFTKKTTNEANGSSTSKNKPIPMNTGILLKQQPIVKLHSSPATESDTENEVDDKFDRKYEELLTFETNEDERREQRLLKALSDIAAKAKQKIQSITDSNVAKTNTHADRNHNDRSVSKINKMVRQSAKKANEMRDERHAKQRQTSEDRYENDCSPKEREKRSMKRDSSKRSKRDSSYSSTTSKEEDEEQEDEEEANKSARSSRSPSIPRRRGSPSFLDRRRITSARKKPIPYQRSSPYDSYDEWDSS